MRPGPIFYPQNLPEYAEMPLNNHPQQAGIWLFYGQLHAIEEVVQHQKPMQENYTL